MAKIEDLITQIPDERRREHRHVSKAARIPASDAESAVLGRTGQAPGHQGCGIGFFGLAADENDVFVSSLGIGGAQTVSYVGDYSLSRAN